MTKQWLSPELRGLDVKAAQAHPEQGRRLGFIHVMNENYIVFPVGIGSARVYDSS